jgi:hypothetical protein
MQKAVSIASSIFICFSLLISCSKPKSASLTPPTRVQIEEFSHNANIDFPSSAKFTAWREERGMDDALWLQVRIPKKDFKKFLIDSHLITTKLTSSDLYISYLFKDFYTTAPTHYQAGQQQLPNARVLNILFEESDNSDVTVYLMWHET